MELRQQRNLGYKRKKVLESDEAELRRPTAGLPHPLSANHCLSTRKIGAVTVLGEAFESVNGRSYIQLSDDGGKTFSAPRAMFDHAEREGRLTDYAKAIALPDGRILAVGYAYLRDDPTLPIGNAANGGVLDDFVFWSISEDEGKTSRTSPRTRNLLRVKSKSLRSY